MPSHYLNKCWNIVNWTLRNKLQLNSNQTSYIFIQENSFENVCQIAAILSRPQCVKDKNILTGQVKDESKLTWDCREEKYIFWYICWIFLGQNNHELIKILFLDNETSHDALWASNPTQCNMDRNEYYFKIFIIIRCTKFQNLNVSHLVLQLSLLNPF